MSETARRKMAIILRGPPAVGKSSITMLLATKMLPGSTKGIDLDDGWGEDQKRRFPAGEGRYADLKTSDDLLVLELGCGEPVGWVFEGATRNPGEWVEVLEREGRQIYSFLLTAEHATWRKRMLKKVKGNETNEEAFYRLFDLQEWKEFPTKARVREEQIDTTTIDQQGVAARIWQQIQQVTPAPPPLGGAVCR